MSRMAHVHSLLTDFAGLPRDLSFSDLGRHTDDQEKQTSGESELTKTNILGPLKAIRPDPIATLIHEMAAVSRTRVSLYVL